MAIAYNIFLLCSCIYAAAAGGRAGRWCVILVVSTTLMTIVAWLSEGNHKSVGVLLFTTDIVFLLGLTTLAIRSGRWWPIWMAAFQLNGVCAHIVALTAPVFIRPVYYAMSTFWGIPILLAMIGGVMLDRRFARRNARIVTLQDAKNVLRRNF